MIEIKDLTIRSTVYKLHRNGYEFGEEIITSIGAADAGMVSLKTNNNPTIISPLQPKETSFKDQFNNVYYCNKEDVEEQIKLGLQDRLLELRLISHKANKEYDDFIDTHFIPTAK